MGSRPARGARRAPQAPGVVPVVAVAVGVIGFAVAFAGWRWGLGDRNWLEGGLVALVAGAACGLAAHAVLRALAVAGRA